MCTALSSWLPLVQDMLYGWRRHIRLLDRGLATEGPRRWRHTEIFAQIPSPPLRKKTVYSRATKGADCDFMALSSVHCAGSRSHFYKLSKVCIPYYWVEGGIVIYRYIPGNLDHQSVAGSDGNNRHFPIYTLCLAQSRTYAYKQAATTIENLWQLASS
jgi:hypothetical protein